MNLSYQKRVAATVLKCGVNRVWVEANLKETQLTHVREGQDVTVEVDAYHHQLS